jgi:ribosomal protein S21
MKVGHVKVTNTRLYEKDQREQDKNLKIMLSMFKKKTNDSGILNDCRAKEFYESPGQKIRRKKKESRIRKFKESLYSNKKEKEDFFGSWLDS